MIRAVFFDFYGTLADWPQAEYIQRDAAAAEGIALDPEAVLRAYASANAYMDAENAREPVHRRTQEERDAFYAEYERRILAGAGAEDASLETAARVWRRVADAPSDLALFPDAKDALEELRGLGLTLGVISNIGASLDAHLDRLGVGHLLTARVTTLDVGASKPDARIFRRALDQAQAEPSEAVHVGDSVFTDVRGARNAGIAPVLIRRSPSSVESPPEGVPVVASLREAAALARAMVEAG